MKRQNVIVVIAPTIEVWGNFRKLCVAKGFDVLAEICENDYITDGELVMSNGDEKVHFVNGAFVTRKNGEDVKRFERSQLSEMQQEQLFCIWAGRRASLPRNIG